MSNVIVQGWEWLEAELHKALEIIHQSTPPDGLKNGAKSAVSAVLRVAKAEALEAAKTAAVVALDAGINGAVTGAVGQPVADLLDTDAVVEAAAEGTAEVVEGAASTDASEKE